MLSVSRIVIVLVEPTGRIDLASVACARRTITAFTGKLDEAFAIRATFPFILATPVICARSRQSAFELQFSMKLDLFADCGIILANCLGDGGLG